ncbi:MAG: hypothetical protein E6R03_06315 [Hyphomicrobiaceae bacterium]|nr:MAG: hypothetical protein E6R03_06315 [Hyphomicrobiaceae bacterium]
MLKPTDPFDIKLSSGRETRAYGIVLDEGAGALSIGATAADDSVYIRNVGKRPGDFDEQRGWKGGRGVEKFNDNDEGFWDSLNAWTLTKGHVHNGILQEFGKGLRTAQDNLSDSKSWKAMYSGTRSISVSFTADTTADYDKAYMWVRWAGSSVATNALTFKLHSDSSGSPGTVLQTVTKAVTDVDGDAPSVFMEFDWSGTQNLVSGTTYHITLTGATSSTKDTHWEVAADADGTSSKISSDASTYTSPAVSFSALYRITDADTARRFFPFFLDNHLYVVDQKDDGTTASQLYINGDKGQATGGSTTTLIDTNFGCRTSAWSDNVLAGATLKFKKNNRWYYATIASHTGSTYTFSSATAVAPASGNPYHIYSTKYWTEITGHGLGVVTGEPATLGENVYFPQGDSTAIRCMANDFTASQAHKFRAEAGTNPYATFLKTSYDKSDGAIVWRANNDSVSVSYAKYVAYATNLTFNMAITCGDKAYPITGVNEQPGQLYVYKENGVGAVAGGQFVNLQSGNEDTPDESNGSASLVVEKFMFYSWLHSVVRVYGSSFDDIGQDYRSQGLPDGREGEAAFMDAYIILPLFAVDAGSGISSVLAFDGIGWHEVIRGYGAGKRIRMVKVQPNPNARNRIWFEIGGELMFIDMPLKKSSPLLDSGMKYQHEAVIESAIIDMGAASDMPKFIKSLSVTVKNLSAEGRSVRIDYQTDKDCHTTTWTNATDLFESPESTAKLNINNIRRFVYRMILTTNSATLPIDIEGVVPNGYARTPLKQVFSLRIKSGGIYASGTQTKMSTNKLWKWLMDNARFPYAVRMESKYEELDGYYVIVHPPRNHPYQPPRPGQSGESVLSLVLEEI